MDAALLAKLIVEVGLPAAMKLYDWIEQKQSIGPAEIAELRALGRKTADDYLEAAGGAPKAP